LECGGRAQRRLSSGSRFDPRRALRDYFSVELKLSAIEFNRARDDFDQLRFTRAILADERVHFPARRSNESLLSACTPA
jgi:hypothetical protein